MNRRLFLKALAAAGVAAALPLPALLPAPPSIKRSTEMFDYGFMRGLAVSAEAGGQRYRHGWLLPEQTWHDMTVRQQEEMWRRLEDLVVRRWKLPV